MTVNAIFKVNIAVFLVNCYIDNVGTKSVATLVARSICWVKVCVVYISTFGQIFHNDKNDKKRHHLNCLSETELKLGQ